MKLDELGGSVENLSGIGPAAAKLFARLNIFTIADLLKTFPKSYDDRTRKVSLRDFAGASKVHTICQVKSHEWFGYGRMKTLKLHITDGTASACLVAFNRPFLEKSLPVGSIISVTGKFEVKYNILQSSAFEAERIAYDGILSDFENTPMKDSALLPVYSLTEGLNQKNFRKAVAQALKQYGKAIDNDLPENIIKEAKLISKSQSIFAIHQPENFQQLQEARYALIFEELYFFEYKMAQRSLEHRGSLPSVEQSAVFEVQQDSANSSDDTPSAAPFFTVPEVSESEFESHLSPRQKKLHEKLPFKLTQGQMSAILEMDGDIDRSQKECNTMINTPELLKSSPFSMQRLLQGDVGSGKTLVAFFICLRVIDYGGQCVLLAPTELLARQHAENASELLESTGVMVAFLTGNLKASGREKLLNALKDGTVNIAVGTHALFSHNVQYKKLQLAVIDEQHRFGVTQRESIVSKGRQTVNQFSHCPDVLMMSATPIPQTLALTVFGDLDISTIHTMPNGRKPVKTYLSVMGHENNVYEAVRKELAAGHQAYFVYPRISETLQEEDSQEGLISSRDNSIKAAEEMFTYLSKNIYSDYRCALVHGKVDEEEQNKILADFKENKVQVLIATTVVEVGVDVPNATCIVIEHADRFGLAALHQLRGRVGRSELQSYCFLIYGKNITEEGILRMKALRESTDGFRIAEEDLRLRGPGEVSGTAQSGYLTLSIADLSRDKEILKMARYYAINQLKSLSEN